MKKETKQDMIKLLEQVQEIATEKIELRDEEIGTEKDIYGQIRDIINNIEELD